MREAFFEGEGLKERVLLEEATQWEEELVPEAVAFFEDYHHSREE